MTETGAGADGRDPRILWIATKRPSPPVDGGRLLVAHSLEALRRRGSTIEFLAPESTTKKSWLEALVDAFRTGLPLPVARHVDRELADRVGRAAFSFRPDLVHVEQVHGVPQAAAALARGIPGVLRAQNVESDLWRQASRRRVWAPLGRVLARRFGRWEGRTVAAMDLTMALTAADRDDLEALAGGGARVVESAVPFPEELPAGDAVEGDPALSLFVGRGWSPTRDGGDWFVRRVWPFVRSRCPEARLHVFGELGRAVGGEGVVLHPAPRDSRTAFPEGGILAVPLHVGSGIRMKILEAWSRGLPVVATSRAVRGLRGEDGRDWIVRDDPGALAESLLALGRDRGARNRLVAGGRARLREAHAPDRFASSYLDAVAGLWMR